MLWSWTDRGIITLHHKASYHSTRASIENGWNECIESCMLETQQSIGTTNSPHLNHQSVLEGLGGNPAFR